MTKYAIGITVLTTFLWLLNGIRIIGAVSKGESIGERPRTALLLVDLQTVFWNDGPYQDNEKAAAKAVILEEVSKIRATGEPVIAVRQEWSQPSTKAIAWLTMKGRAIEGRDGNEIAAEFDQLADKVLVKRVQDAFETGELDALLQRFNVGALRIVGLDLNYCVAKTALAARERGYKVTIVDRGTLAAAPAGRMRARLASHAVLFE